MNWNKNILIFLCICFFSSMCFANEDTTLQKHSVGLYFTPSMFTQNIKFRLSWTAGFIYEYNFSQHFFLRTGIAHSIYKTIEAGPETTDEIVISDDRFLFIENPLLARFNIVKINERNRVFISAGVINLLLYNIREKSTYTVTGGRSEWIYKKIDYVFLPQTSAGIMHNANEKITFYVEPMLTYHWTGIFIIGLSVSLKKQF